MQRIQPFPGPVEMYRTYRVEQEPSDVLARCATALGESVQSSVRSLDPGEFGRAVSLLTDRSRRITAVGGWFSHLAASYLVAVLREVRPDVHLVLQADLGVSYLFISHDLSVVRYVSDVIGVMYLGKLVEAGPSDDVYYRPVHPYTRGLIDTIPVADPVLAQAREEKGVVGELPSAIGPPSGCRFRTRCPYAQDICAAEEPALQPFTPDGHQAACHFPLRKQEMPVLSG